MFYAQFKKVRLRAMRESLRTIQTIWRERRKARAPLVLKKAKKKKKKKKKKSKQQGCLMLTAS